MTTFVIAKLVPLPGKEQARNTPAKRAGTPDDGAVEVQFNPTSLRVQRPTSQLRSSMSTKDQRVQYPSTQAATLTFDLEFDTAEEVTGTGEPVDVHTRTKPIRQLVLPPAGKPAAAPPRVRFEWGTFAFQGVVTQLTEEFDYFATNGTPLRAKMSLTIQEQDPAQEALEKGPGARTDRATTGPGSDLRRSAVENPPGPQPGHSGTRDPLQTVAARAGESVQQLAARIGGDPGAWRSLMSGLGTPLGLAAGTPVVVGPELDTPLATGQSFGFAAGATVSPAQGLSAALGMVANAAADLTDLVAPPLGGAPGPAETAGFALSAAGGLAAATRTVLAAEIGEAVGSARTSFAVPTRPASPGSPMDGTAPGGPVDPRALSYGRALPLRTRAHAPTAEDARTGGVRALAARAQPAEITASGAGSAPPWERLPPASAGRAASDAVQRGRDARPSTMRWRPGGGCR